MLRSGSKVGVDDFIAVCFHYLSCRGCMREGRIAPLSAVIFYPAVKCTKSVCMSRVGLKRR